jgi:hypothetical protein
VKTFGLIAYRTIFAAAAQKFSHMQLQSRLFLRIFRSVEFSHGLASEWRLADPSCFSQAASKKSTRSRS